MQKVFLSLLTACLMIPTIAAAQAPATAAESVASAKLIPRSALFGNPEKAQARVSPDGKYISFIAPRDGVLNVWLSERGKLDAAKPITNDRKRGIRQHMWAFDNRHVLYMQDSDGDENWHVYAVDVVSGEDKTSRRTRARAPRSSTCRGRSPAWSPSASTTACRSGMTSGKSTSPPASARWSRRTTPNIAGYLARLRPEAATALEDRPGRHGDPAPRRRQVGEPAQVRPGRLADHLTAGRRSQRQRPRCCSPRWAATRPRWNAWTSPPARPRCWPPASIADVDQIWLEPKTASRRRTR